MRGLRPRSIDAYHYEIIKEMTGKTLVIRDTDVKAIVGDLWHDYIGICEERHGREIVPLIENWYISGRYTGRYLSLGIS